MPKLPLKAAGLSALRMKVEDEFSFARMARSVKDCSPSLGEKESFTDSSFFPASTVNSEITNSFSF